LSRRKAAEPQIGRYAGLRRLLVPFLSIGFAILAVIAVRAVLRDVGPAQVRAALDAIRSEQIVFALLLTAVSFSAIASFDVLAVRSVAPGEISAGRAAVAGAASHAVSNLLGFGAVTSGVMRYRIYSVLGLDAADILRIYANSSVTFWFGFVALLAAALILDPRGITALRPLGIRIEIFLGLGLAAALAYGVVWLGRAPRVLRIFRWSLPLPRREIAVGQIIAGSIDLAASAGVLYVVLPPEAMPAFPYFIVLYCGAILLGLASHAPGGFGVFEAAIIAALGQTMSAGVIAGLIIYRLVYYVVPFVIAASGLAVWEGLRNKRRISAAAEQTARTLGPLVPLAAALIAFLSGTVLLFSAALAPEIERLQSLREWLPLFVVESSHLIGSIIGVALLLVARGLLRRLSAAWLLTEILLLAGAAASLLKGLDWDEALVLVAMALVLYVFRASFYRGGPVSALRVSPGWLAMALSACMAAAWLGFFNYRHVDYAQELWWQFAWSGGAPRFLRAMVVVAAVLVWAAVDLFMRRAFDAKFVPDPVSDDIRALVAASPLTQTNVALLGDKKFLMSSDRAGFLMYGHTGRSWITMGDPVGAGTAAPDLIWAFRELADRAGGNAVYYAVGQTYLPIYIDMGLSILKIGEVARVELSSFTFEGSKRGDFRRADRRVDREGMSFAIVPKAEVPSHMGALRRVSDEWLRIKSGHEKAFSLGNFSDAYMAEFDCAVLSAGEEIVAFANIWRSAGKNEISVDLMRHLPDRGNFLMDALFARLLLYGRDSGYRWFNLGAAPLAGLADHPLASSWSRIGTLLYRHAEDFYGFEGLKAFKQKFDPVWTPQYLACPSGFGIATALIDVTALISGGRSSVLMK
jgi:phosphatidylglycerol lysyltransferase